MRRIELATAAAAAPQGPAAMLTGMGLALAIGLLIGAERGWQARDEQPGARVAGIRTFSLIGLLGGLAGLQLETPLRLLSALLVAGALAAILVGYRADIRRDNNLSATSTIAAILTLGWGALASSGQMALASVGAGATLLLLASRALLHKLVGLTSASDMRALMRLVLVVLVILPLLPDQGMGPFGALNPRRIWLVVVTTGAISFAGYLLARWWGSSRGTLIVAAVGAMVSSTAVTVDSARRLREGSASPADDACVPVASSVMLARSLVLVALLAPRAIGAVATMVGPALALSIVAAAMLLYRGRHAAEKIELREPRPPGLGLALLFAASVAVLALATAWVANGWGDRNAALLIAAGGTVDIDAAIAAVGALPPQTLSTRVAALALAAPTLLNTLFKLALFVGIAGWRRARTGALTLIATSIALAATIGMAVV